MAQHFLNTDPVLDTPLAQGWSSAAPFDNNRIPKIIDTIQGGFALQKMGTSIPHPFARLFVFDTAFNEVNNPTHGHDIVNTSYSKLVSECLDLLEFIYQYGNQIEVRQWGQTDLQNLANSTYKGHKKLEHALSRALRNLSYVDAGGNVIPVTSIYLFFYQGALLGGTSPYSLVFTSPNISKNLKNVQAAGFKGLSDNELFQDYSLETTVAIPLHIRSQQFREFLWHYYFAYQNVLNQTSLGRYISHSGSTYFPMDWNRFMAMTADEHQAKFDPVTGNYSTFTITIGYNQRLLSIVDDTIVMPLGYRKTAINPGVQQVVSDDYEIRPDYEIQDEIKPLVLNEAGIPGAKLVNGNPIPENITFIPTSPEHISERTLGTGQNIKYPHIYVDDLLEDMLVELPYAVDDVRFVTATCGKKSFLVPVKPLLLKYFKAEKISKMLSIRQDEADYMVSLDIPIKYKNRSISLTKKIPANNVVNLNDGAHLLGVALFPSYRVENREDLNIYKILVSVSECDAEVEFYKGYGILNVDLRSIHNGENKFYTIKNSSFDVARITIKKDGQQAVGMVIPIFIPVNAVSNDKTVVGVDFGTTNTYACIKTDSRVDSLGIAVDRPQVLTLNKVDLTKGNKGEEYKRSMTPAGIEDFYYTFVRQFVPHVIGTADSTASFPFRTIVCENEAYEANPASGELLSDVSIGFNNLNEATNAPRYKYVSNLKWLLDNSTTSTINANEGRVELFIKELAWLIKNSIMLSGNPSTSFTVYTTYPGSMRQGDINTIDNFWTQAFNDLIPGGEITINSDIKESAAPFLYLLGNTGAVATNSVNVDIGGGTTDILYIDAKNKKMYADSSRFAGNDLWGDGIDRAVMTNFSNGFVNKIIDLVNAGTIDLKKYPSETERFKQQQELSKSSADLMSYVFRNEDIYTPKKYFSTEPSLKAALFTHFSALCYHIARTLKTKGIDASHLTVRFSGFGSKYISMILPSAKAIENVMKQMFKVVGIDASGLKVDTDNQVSPKEVTARGAVIAHLDKVRNKLSEFTDGELCPEEIVLNFEKTDDITNKEMSHKTDEVIDDYINFIDEILTKGDYYRYLHKEYSISFSDAFKDALKNYVSISSAVSQCAEYDDDDSDDPVKESAFFWPFKETLIKATNA